MQLWRVGRLGCLSSSPVQTLLCESKLNFIQVGLENPPGMCSERPVSGSRINLLAAEKLKTRVQEFLLLLHYAVFYLFLMEAEH